MRTPIPFAACFLLVLASPALAGWPNAPTVNLPVCTAANAQQNPAMVSDGAGGAIVAWSDYRGFLGDIYAQHVLATGVVDPAWPANGRAICTAPADQYFPEIETDGAGGALIVWEDNRAFNLDVYAQHVLASGVVDPAWPVNGRALCVAANTQFYPKLVSDGVGGAIAAWMDGRGSSNDVYAQHVLASGLVDPAWPVDGKVLCGAASSQQNVVLTTDGAGGALVVWEDWRDLYAHPYAVRVLATGALGAGWPADGRQLSNAPAHEVSPTVAPDGAGGAFVTYMSYQPASVDIYAGHVLASGNTDFSWPTTGLPVCTNAADEQFPVITDDGVGGAYIAWQDFRGGDWNIYGQHVRPSGAIATGWAADGSAVSVVAGSQITPAIASDGAGGAFVAWRDARTSAYADVYAHHLVPAGPDPVWPANGQAVCTASELQSLVCLTADGAGGAVLAWQDRRSGGDHVYGQRVARFGVLGSPEVDLNGVKDVKNDQGGQVKVSWNASYLEQDPIDDYLTYIVFRSVPSSLATERAAAGRLRAMDAATLAPGDVVATADAAGTIYWEWAGAVNTMNVPGYSFVAATTGDSIGGSNPLTAFMVQTRFGSQYWNSQAVSGYSVDNLPPAAPAPFTGQYAAGASHLHWNPNVEADIAVYRLYRGTSAGFVPGPGNLVGELPDTGYVDAPGGPRVYKLTAVDSHGNESPVATLIPSGALGVEDGAPANLALAPPSPNPAASATTLRCSLPHATSLRLAIYDAAGRLVRSLADGARPAGEHAFTWDLRDVGGRPVSPGLYFARFEAEGRTLVRRVAVAR